MRTGARCVALLVAVFASPHAVGQERRARPHSKRVDKLIKSLELPGARAASVAAILELGAEAAPDLGRAIHDPRPEIVFCVAHMLHMLGSAAEAARVDIERGTKREERALAEAARWALAAIRPRGITLVADYKKARVVEIDSTGKILREITNLPKVWNAQRLPNGNTLVLPIGPEVREVDAAGKEVWRFKHDCPLRDAERLPDGNTLAVDDKARVGLISPKGKLVWVKQLAAGLIYDVDRLPSGHTLVSHYGRNRVFEIDDTGKQTRLVWKGTPSHGVLKSQRLSNGNTLITLYTSGRVIEVDDTGKTVLDIKGLASPNDARRLPDGRTLVGERGRVRIFDRGGKEVWKFELGRATSVERY